MTGKFIYAGTCMIVLSVMYTILGWPITTTTMLAWGVSSFLLAGAVWLVDHLGWKHDA